MSQKKKTLTRAAFRYAQFALAMVRGFLVIPMMVHYLGARECGIWLACGEALAYLWSADLGVFATVPFLVATAHGANRTDALRAHLANARAVGFAAAGVALAVGLLAWCFAGFVFGGFAADYERLQGPMAALVLGVSISWCFKLYPSVLLGLQDVMFIGCLEIAKTVLSIVLMAVLLHQGWGIWGLVASTIFPVVLTDAAYMLRARISYAELFRDWPRPNWSDGRRLLREGAGTWLAGLGGQLIVASNGLIILVVGSAELVPIYACTAKLFQMGERICQVLPESAGYSLARLYGEGAYDRLKKAVLGLLRFQFLLAGCAAGCVVGVNHFFVRWWVGEGYFGGDLLNVCLAVSVFALSLVNGLKSHVLAAGHRWRVGQITLLQGVVFLALAVPLGWWIGLAGLPIAALVSGLAISLSSNLHLAQQLFRLERSHILSSACWPVLLRVLPYIGAAGFASITLPGESPWELGAVLLLLGAAFAWSAAPLIRDLPWPDRLRAALARPPAPRREAA